MADAPSDSQPWQVNDCQGVGGGKVTWTARTDSQRLCRGPPALPLAMFWGVWSYLLYLYGALINALSPCQPPTLLPASRVDWEQVLGLGWGGKEQVAPYWGGRELGEPLGSLPPRARETGGGLRACCPKGRHRDERGPGKLGGDRGPPMALTPFPPPSGSTWGSGTLWEPRPSPAPR